MKFFGRHKKEEGRRNLNQPGQKVISYYTASRRQLDNFERNAIYNQNPTIKNHFFKRSWFSFVAWIALAIILGYLCLLGSEPHIVVVGPNYRTTGYYQKVAGDVLKQDFRNRFKFLLLSNKVRASLLSDLPETETIEIKSSFLGHRPEIKITNSSYLGYFSQANGNYILSARGRLLLPVIESKIDFAGLPTIQNQTGVKGKEGGQFLSPDEASALSQLIGQYKADKTNPNFILTVVPHELTAIEPDRGYYAKYQLNTDILSQYGALRAAEKRMQETGQTPPAEYIDVRLTNKVYFK